MKPFQRFHIKVLHFLVLVFTVSIFTSCKTSTSKEIVNNNSNKTNQILSNSEESYESINCGSRRKKVLKAVDELGLLGIEEVKLKLTDDDVDKKIEAILINIENDVDLLYKLAVISRLFYLECSTSGVYEIAFWKCVRKLANRKDDEIAKFKLELLKERSGVGGADLGEFEAIMKGESFPY